MNNNLSLNSEQFDNKRLNKSFFTNINKGITEEQFSAQYPSDQFDNFEKGIVQSYINDVLELTGGEIIKGGFNDTPEVAQIIENAKHQISLLKGVLIEDDFGTREVFVLEKAKESEEDTELEKGKIYDAVHYSDMKISFKKTGAEIKAKLATVKTEENDKLVDLKSKMNNLLEKIPYTPTEGFADDCGVKSFKWEMTYSDSASKMGSISYSDMEQGTISKEHCDLCREYNDLVYKYRDCKQELNAICLLEENLEDKKAFDLTARQMILFGF